MLIGYGLSMAMTPLLGALAAFSFYLFLADGRLIVPQLRRKPVRLGILLPVGLGACAATYLWYVHAPDSAYQSAVQAMFGGIAGAALTGRSLVQTLVKRAQREVSDAQSGANVTKVHGANRAEDAKSGHVKVEPGQKVYTARAGYRWFNIRKGSFADSRSPKALSPKAPFVGASQMMAKAVAAERRGDYETALNRIEQAIEVALERDRLYEAEARRTKALILTRMGNLKQATQAFEEAARCFGSDLGRANLLLQQAEVLAEGEYAAEAQAKFFEAMEVYRAIGEQLGMAKAAKGLAEVVSKQGLDSEAIKRVRETVVDLEATGALTPLEAVEIRKLLP